MTRKKLALDAKKKVYYTFCYSQLTVLLFTVAFYLSRPFCSSAYLYL